MARDIVFISLLLVSLFSISLAKDDMNTINDASFNETRHVCHPSRFEQLGLDMKDFAFCDSSLSFSVRVKDLVDRMTLLEKAQQLGDNAYGVARIGLPSYEWWSEALHGVSFIGNNDRKGSYFDEVVPGATSFPMVITTAATFNQTLWKTIGQVVSTEARAMHNLGNAGLTFWSPNINVVRDPRWGRILETPGEDPFVVGTYSVNFVRGLQDIEGTENVTDLNSRPLKVAACCKHYAAYDLDRWQGVDRLHFDARVSEQDMMETFLKPFEMCVKEGDASSVMCSYNRINGIPTCTDTKLLKDTVRGDWNLHGYIVSDCDSIEVILDDQKWLNDEPEDAVSQALKAGLDLDCGNYYTKFAANAVESGKVRESEIDKALKYLYTTLMRLGLFDGSPKFDSLGHDDICSEDHIELAAQAARQGIVLLKNDNNTLPLDSANVKTLAVVGPHANATKAMIGNYEGVPCKYTTPIEGFTGYTRVYHEMGCANVHCKNESLIFPAVRAAKKADATVVVVGLDLSVEAEDRDRMDLLLPGYQTQLVNQVAADSKGPVILVVMSGGGVDISFAKKNPKIQAILWAGYPGEEGGRAIADIVFGNYNPGGKLPLTWHEASYTDALPMTSMPLRAVETLGYPGRTYKFFNGATVYPFGHGLSYTVFNYHLTAPQRQLNVKLNKFQHCRDVNYTAGSHFSPCPAVLIDDLDCSDAAHKVEFEVEVENAGERDGSEVVMVYWVPPPQVAAAPQKQVIAFEKVFVAAGKKEKVKFVVDACKSLGFVDYKGYNLLTSGAHTVMVGDGKVSFIVNVEFQT
nr:beta-xylosidasealpha-l-arabinofuranosidase 1 [Ipomoea trifida]